MCHVLLISTSNYDPVDTGSLPQYNPHSIHKHRVCRGREDISFLDLTRVFGSEESAVYVDTCYHMKELGYEIMIAEIAKHIAPPTRRRPKQ